MTDASLVRVEIDDRIALVTIHRPEKLNALNAEVIEQLGQAFERLRDDDAVLGVILTGAGEKAFVAGADIAELAEMDGITGVATSRQGQAVFTAIERFPKPVLAVCSRGRLRTRPGLSPAHRLRQRPLRAARGRARDHSRLRGHPPAGPAHRARSGDRDDAHR